MKKIILFCFVCLYSSLVLAHKTNEAFFIITEKEKTIEIEAEFPWTMRNALIKNNSSLENGASKADFENTFIAYIKANLILKNKFGKILEFKNYKELDNNGHSHQNTYLLVFKGSHLNEVTNTIMFNLYEHQINYNKLTLNSKTYKTSKALNHFDLNQKNVSNKWYLLFLLVPFFFLIYRFHQKNSSQQKL